MDNNNNGQYIVDNRQYFVEQGRCIHTLTVYMKIIVNSIFRNLMRPLYNLINLLTVTANMIKKIILNNIFQEMKDILNGEHYNKHYFEDNGQCFEENGQHFQEHNATNDWNSNVDFMHHFTKFVNMLKTMNDILNNTIQYKSVIMKSSHDIGQYV